MKKTISISLIAFTLIIGCKKKDNTTPETTVPVTTTVSITESTEEYLRYDFGGVSYNIKSSLSGGLWWSGSGYSLYTSSSSSIPNILSKAQRYYFSSNDVVEFTISDTTRELTSHVSDNTIRSLTQKRNLKYENDYLTFTSPSLSLLIKDNLGVWWSSSKYSVTGSGKSYQTSSNYAINELVEFTYPALVTGDLSLKRKFKANFNCKLYNSLGDSTLLNNGEMIISIVNYK